MLIASKSFSRDKWMKVQAGPRVDRSAPALASQLPLPAVTMGKIGLVTIGAPVVRPPPDQLKNEALPAGLLQGTNAEAAGAPSNAAARAPVARADVLRVVMSCLSLTARPARSRVSLTSHPPDARARHPRAWG